MPGEWGGGVSCRLMLGRINQLIIGWVSAGCHTDGLVETGWLVRSMWSG